ncbi:hypothetical protein BH18ACT1_BH18ACT1_08190 [soil metagenome]
MARLLKRTRAPGPQLGPALPELPPNLPVELERLDATLACFGRVPVAVEARHETWFTDATYELLARRCAALCLADRRNQRGPIVHTADCAQVRLHEGDVLAPALLRRRQPAVVGAGAGRRPLRPEGRGVASAHVRPRSHRPAAQPRGARSRPHAGEPG